ncbi:MAG TPA: DUF5606 domain-containing protein [Bacteroidales bacterium]|jgi:hypothetical protein|nr:DUF5606 domain-containing protein [Bacteroidales bacterium]
MNLKQIMAISGKSGLFKLVSQAKRGVIVESLTDGKRFPAFLNDRISSLEEISIYTTSEDKPLKEVFEIIKEKYNNQPVTGVGKENKDIKEFFGSILPDYDSERVYVSDMKKVLNWYNQLAEKNLLDLPEETIETESEENSSEA